MKKTLFLLVLLLILPSVCGKTVVIGGDDNVSVAQPENVTVTAFENLTKSDFDKLVDLTDSLINSLALLERQNEYLLARENSTQAKLSTYEEIIDGYRGTVQDQEKTIGSMDRRNQQIQNSYDAVIDQQLIIQGRLTRYETTYWVSVIVVFILAYIVSKAWFLFKLRGKNVWFIKWIRSWYPFRVGLPDTKKVRFRTKKYVR